MQAPRVEGRMGVSIFSVRLFPASEKNGKIVRYLLVVVQAEISDRRSANTFTIIEVLDPAVSCCEGLRDRHYHVNNTEVHNLVEFYFQVKVSVGYKI